MTENKIGVFVSLLGVSPISKLGVDRADKGTLGTAKIKDQVC